MGREANTKQDAVLPPIRIETAKRDRLRAIAESQHRNLSQQVRFLVDECIERESLEEAA